MFKGFIFGFLSSIILCGIFWFIFGRASISDIRESTVRFDGDLERTEQLISEFGNDFDRYSGKISLGVGKSEQLRDQIGDLREEFRGYTPEVGIIKQELESIFNGINSVEKSVRRSNIISRDFAGVLYEYRELGKKGRTEE